MQKNTAIIIAIVTLVAGLGIGYQLGGSRGSFETANQNTPGTHMMPNGQMMGNGASMSMADMMTSMNAELEGKTGDLFDQAFLAEMIVHHQGAVEMAELALTNAKHQELKDLATGIISAQNKEIAEMKLWQTDWYNQ
ncbi:DUF305 domain-containing protein [Candidatus Nomurabacteria bacterium]|jgi:uncharacterized protein (DUF305 family)|nr:MAG: DUF305 domain-containing protein [Candidatus Nomurabacteria bacterium]